MNRQSREACHKKAWDMVSGYLTTNCQLFEGRSLDAESTVLPAMAGWVNDTIQDLPETWYER